MAESFEQLVYCDTEDPVIGSDDGVNVAASSFSPDAEDDLQYWHELLHPLVRVHPRDTLCYFVSDKRGQAALMYRTFEQSGRRQPFVHVLIGPQVELKAKIALGSFRWNWNGAIKKRPEPLSKVLPTITGKRLDSFIAAANEGWYEAAVKTGERPAELYELIAKIQREGGPADGPLSFANQDSLLSLGDNDFAILSDSDSGPDSVPLPIRVLARLLVMLGAHNDDILSKSIIGSGFSTHEQKYRTAQTKLPRWVFATAEDDGTFKLKRSQIDLKNVTLTDSLQRAAETFADDFTKALQKYRLEQTAEVSPGPSPDGVDPGKFSPAASPLSEGSSEEERQTQQTSSQGEFRDIVPDEPLSDASEWGKAPPTVQQPILNGPPPPGGGGADFASESTADANPLVSLSEASSEGVAPVPGEAPAYPVQQQAPWSIGAPRQSDSDPGAQETKTTRTAGSGDRTASANSGAPFGPEPQPPVQPSPQTSTRALQVYGQSGSDSGLPVLWTGGRPALTQGQHEPNEFANLSDEQLVEKLLSLRGELFESMVNSLRLRTARHQEEIRRRDPVNLSRVREFLMKEEFAAKRIGGFTGDYQLRLYGAICEFAVSDQLPGSRNSNSVIAQLIRALASDEMSVCQLPGVNGRIDLYYPLADAMMRTVIPRTEDHRIAHEFGPIFKSVVGRRRGELLGYEFEPAPEAEEHAERSVTEARYAWANKRSAILTVALFAFVIICVCIGYLP